MTGSDLRELDLFTDGAVLRKSVLSGENLDVLAALAARMPAARAGQRLFDEPALTDLLGQDGAVGLLAKTYQGAASRPVRALLFDKTPALNWAVPWHQDRTIAVRERYQQAGFDVWSIKEGVPHVEPPFEIMARLLTLRVHIDDCDADNAPLLVVPGSHRFGRIRASETAATARLHGHVACLAEAGDVWVYATPILHASERAARPRHRRVLQVDFAAEDLPGGLSWLGIFSL